ncbi:hypothetical protein ACGFZS_18990 [Streptomyces sp. NPDC048288]
MRSCDDPLFRIPGCDEVLGVLDLVHVLGVLGVLGVPSVAR